MRNIDYTIGARFCAPYRILHGIDSGWVRQQSPFVLHGAVEEKLMTISRRKVLTGLAAAGLSATTAVASKNGGFSVGTKSTKNPTAPCLDPIYEKPPAISEVEFGNRSIQGVQAAEVNDFS